MSWLLVGLLAPLAPVVPLLLMVVVADMGGVLEYKCMVPPQLQLLVKWGVLVVIPSTVLRVGQQRMVVEVVAMEVHKLEAPRNGVVVVVEEAEVSLLEMLPMLVLLAVLLEQSPEGQPVVEQLVA
jgi:hypothetical protein